MLSNLPGIYILDSRFRGNDKGVMWFISLEEKMVAYIFAAIVFAAAIATAVTFVPNEVDRFLRDLKRDDEHG